MSAILEFLKGIGSAIVAVFEFIIGLVQDIVYLVQLTGSMLAQLPKLLSWLPAPVTAILLSIFTIVVLYKILGREG